MGCANINMRPNCDRMFYGNFFNLKFACEDFFGNWLLIYVSKLMIGND